MEYVAILVHQLGLHYFLIIVMNFDSCAAGHRYIELFLNSSGGDPHFGADTQGAWNGGGRGAQVKKPVQYDFVTIKWMKYWFPCLWTCVEVVLQCVNPLSHTLQLFRGL